MTSLSKILTISLCLFWAIFIFIDYWYYHPEYASAIQYFQYLDTVLLLGVLGAGVFWVKKRWSTKKPLKFLKGGLGLFLLLLLITAIIIWTHYFKVSNEFLDFSGFIFLGKITYLVLLIYLIFGFCFVLGELIINSLFNLSLPKLDDRLIKMAIGVSIFSFILMILAFFNLFNNYLILAMIIGLLGLRWKASINYFKTTILNPLDSKNQLNWLGFSSLFLLLIFIALNLLNNTRPLPFGFDALALYLNLPQLIGSQGGLIEGYSPYYWSLFTAIGYLIFDQTEVAIAIASGGGILSLVVLYAISRRWLDVNKSIVIILFLYSLPIINYQSYRDVKTDLGLLFILLSAFLVLINWLKSKDAGFLRVGEGQEKSLAPTIDDDRSEKEKQPFFASFLSKSEQLIILLGILSGMALGTKLTALIFIFGVLGVFSYMFGGKIGLITNFTLTFAIVLLAKLDTSLRAYHFQTDWLQWSCLIFGIVGLAILAFKQKTDFLKLVKIASIYLLFTGLLYAPWPIKNYKEVGEISFQIFIEGKATGIPTKQQ